jgi:hypothetical protein
MYDEVNNCHIHGTKIYFGGKRDIGAIASYSDGGKFVAYISKGPNSTLIVV